jgi:cell wall-associated NlpC family hydrolase
MTKVLQLTRVLRFDDDNLSSVTAGQGGVRVLAGCCAIEAVALTYGAFAVSEELFLSTTEASAQAGGAIHHDKGTLSVTFRKRFATFILAGSLLGGVAVAMDAGGAGATELPTIAVAATIDTASTSAAAALATMGTPSFAVRLENAANAVAASLEVDAGLLHRAWLAADQPHQVALLSALTQVGVPYHRNASKVGVGFDCSGLTAFAWGQTGAELARNSGAQIRNAAARTRETAQAGDLVYYPGHVMLWLGVDNLIVHAPQRGSDVEVGHISDRRSRRVKFADPIG